MRLDLFPIHIREKKYQIRNIITFIFLSATEAMKFLAALVAIAGV